MAYVERIARRRGITVNWVHRPEQAGNWSPVTRRLTLPSAPSRRRQQHQHRAGAALRGRRGVEGQHVRALPQHAVDQVLQHRQSAVGRRAAGPCRGSRARSRGRAVRVAQEARSIASACARPRHAGRVRPARRISPRLQPLEHARRQRVAAMAQRIARGQRTGVVERTLEFAARVRFVALGHARARLRLRRARAAAASPATRRTGPIAARNSAASSDRRGSSRVEPWRACGHAAA